MATKASTLQRGRPRRLTLTQVIEAAITVVESRGARAMTMEAVAREVGVGTMTLYGYVDSRDDLIDRAVTHLLAGAPAVPKKSNGDWISTVVAHCLAARRWLVERPALLALNAEHPHLTDTIALHYAAELDGLTKIGFSLDDAGVLRHAISAQLFGQIHWEEVRRAAGRTGVLDANRARARGGQVPSTIATASGVLDATDPEELYERSLRALLAGFADSLPAALRRPRSTTNRGSRR